MKKYGIILISGLLAVCFTVYIALDTFVITQVYDDVAVETASASDGTEEATEATTMDAAEAQSQARITDTSYSDGNININISTYREDETNVYVADIQLASADFLKTAFAEGSFGKNVTEPTSTIAEEVGAILAINGDYYGVQESGYVIRNGFLYRSTYKGDQEDLVINQDGSFEIVNESEVSARTLLNSGAQHVLSFGPGLLEAGKITVTSEDEVAQAMTYNPRTAIGIIDKLHYVFLVADGRTSESFGLSLYRLAQFMQSIGVQTAYNLDGGGSSTMVFNGNVINNPTTTGKVITERSVSDIVYIGY